MENNNNVRNQVGQKDLPFKCNACDKSYSKSHSLFEHREKHRTTHKYIIAERDALLFSLQMKKELNTFLWYTLTRNSGENFDSGVDGLQSSSHNVVWNMNEKTLLFQEYAVSFKVSSDAAGVITINVCKLDISGVGACSSKPPICSLLDTSPPHLVLVEKVQENVPGFCLSTTRSPRPPWVAFPTLLAAFSNKTPPESLILLESDYELRRGKNINRNDFIRKLRLTVGDTILELIKKVPALGSNSPKAHCADFPCLLPCSLSQNTSNTAGWIVVWMFWVPVLSWMLVDIRAYFVFLCCFETCTKIILHPFFSTCVDFPTLLAPLYNETPHS